MSTGMPELGSKISLISKADIRYEGHLFTVDPQQCTIALAAVRSFGTEDRESEYPVAPQNQVYDYILFKGTDIKDIRVVNNVPALPNDPAIMQLSVPPSLGKQPFQAPGFAHPVFGQMAPQMGQFGGGYSAMGMAPGMRAPGMVNSKPSELNMPMSGPVPPPDLSCAIMEPTRPHETVNDLIGGGSRSTTPVSLGSRKSPTAEQGTQAGGKKDDKKIVRPIQPPRNKERRDSRGEQQQDYRNQNNRPQQQQQQQMHHRNNQHQNYHQHNQHQQAQHPHQQQQQHPNQQHNNSYHHNNQYPQQQQQQRQGGWVQRGQRGRPRGGGFRPAGTGNFNKQPGTGGPNQQGTGKPKIKFDKEYDFEQANTEFEELCGKLAKSKLEDGKAEVLNGVASTTTSTTASESLTATTTAATTTTVDIDKKDDSGNETGAGDTEQEEDADAFYDKTKSFFDNISCEAVERSKGRSQRTDWRTERKLNSETFGVASARRGGYRGRGGFRGMGFRGGYRGGYRNQQNQQMQGGPRNNQPNHHQQQQGGGHQQQQHRTNNEAAAPVNSAPAPVPAAAGK